jgi:CRISPR associated protein Cas1
LALSVSRADARLSWRNRAEQIARALRNGTLTIIVAIVSHELMPPIEGGHPGARATRSDTKVKLVTSIAKARAWLYDPTIGIMHEGCDGSSKFIFDLMEPERPKVDRAVLDFVKGQVFDPADFVLRSDGVCRLNPQMARMVVAKVSA